MNEDRILTLPRRGRGELEVVWSLASLGQTTVDLADVDGGVDIAMPMLSRAILGPSATCVAFQAFEDAVNGSFGLSKLRGGSLW